MCYLIQEGAIFPNVELYIFNPIFAFPSYSDGKELSPDDSLDEIPEGLPSSEGSIPPEVIDFFISQMSCLDSEVRVIFNSCRPIEGPYIDLTDKTGLTKNRPRWAIGPLTMGTPFEKKHLDTKHECLKWLDKQVQNSVIYVSFGTCITMTSEEINEIALGLEQSEQKFIWVCRVADKGNIFISELAQGFEERTKELGIVVRDWAPQVEILEHFTIGGFLSHCGWNSCLESITMGVPIVAWPMHSDQPRNAYLITNVLMIGVIVRKLEQRDELVTFSIISKAIFSNGVERMSGNEEKGRGIRSLGSRGDQRRWCFSCRIGLFIAHITK